MAEDILENEDSSRHEISDQCRCIDCQRKKSHYIQIIDERYIDNLDDWD